MTKTRSPGLTAPSQIKGHSSDPKRGVVKRTIPCFYSAGIFTTCPLSPNIASREMPALVRSDINGLKNLNQSNVKRHDATAHIKSCQLKERYGMKKRRPPTIIAPNPNQKMVKLGINISAIISTIPNTNQYQ